MFCAGCGKEIPAGSYCSDCMPISRVDLSIVKPEVSRRVLIFGVLSLLPLANLFINILDISLEIKFLSDLVEGFSFYTFVTTITEFECFEGTSGSIFLAMFIMLFASIKLLSVSINAFLWCNNSEKIRKGYKNLGKWNIGFGILSLVAAGECFAGHKSALEDLHISDLVEISIPMPFAIVAVLSIVLGIIVNSFYKKDSFDMM